MAGNYGMKNMQTKYLGKLNKICDMCGKDSTYIYLLKRKWMKELFPELSFEDAMICEKCARREVGKKEWKHVKRGGK